jgi:hypothetical protein
VVDPGGDESEQQERGTTTSSRLVVESDDDDVAAFGVVLPGAACGLAAAAGVGAGVAGVVALAAGVARTWQAPRRRCASSLRIATISAALAAAGVTPSVAATWAVLWGAWPPSPARRASRRRSAAARLSTQPRRPEISAGTAGSSGAMKPPDACAPAPAGAQASASVAKIAPSRAGRAIVVAQAGITDAPGPIPARRAGISPAARPFGAPFDA